MNKILFNISNHPSQGWGEKQKEGWSEIIDIPFPNIDPHMSMGEVWEIAEQTITDVGCRASGIIDWYLTAQKPIYIMCEGEYSFVTALIEVIRKRWVFVILAFPTSERLIDPEGRRQFKFTGWRFVLIRRGNIIHPRSLVLKNGKRLEIYANCADAYIGETEGGRVFVIFEDDPLFPHPANIFFGDIISLSFRHHFKDIYDRINNILLVSKRKETNGWRVINHIKETQQVFSNPKEARRYAYEQALREFYLYNIKQWR